MAQVKQESPSPGTVIALHQKQNEKLRKQPSLTTKAAPRRRRWAHKSKTGCYTCRSRHLKCDEGKPSCQRCVSAGNKCEWFSFPTTEVSRRTNRAVIAYQPKVAVPPVQTDATADELALFHYYRSEVTGHIAEEFNRPLWNLHLLRYAHQDAPIWHACLAMAALHQRHKITKALSPKESNALSNTQRMKQLYDVGLHQYARSLKSIIRMIQDGTSLSFSDKATILSANLLFVGCCIEQGEMPEAMAHMKNAFNLMQQWKFWEPPTAQDVQYSPPTSEFTLPNLPLLLFYVQLDGLVHLHSWSESVSWQWEEALSCLQSRPFTAASEAYLEIEMMWVGIRETYKTKTLFLSPAELQERERHRDTIRVCEQKWRERYKVFRPPSPSKGEPKKTLTTILEMRQILFSALLQADLTKFETCWDEFQPEFEQVVLLIESLLGRPDGDDGPIKRVEIDSYSFMPTLTKSLYCVGHLCRNPSLRRRAGRLLKEQLRRERAAGEKADASFFSLSLEAMIQLEECTWRLSDEERRKQYPDCSCVPDKFVCNNHRVLTFSVQYDGPNKGQLILRIIGDLLNNRPPWTMPMETLVPK